MDPNLQQELKKKKREEMRRYRQKKKEKAAPSVHKSAELTGPKSAELSRKKKEAVKRTQAWRMRIKLKESTQQESNDRLMVKMEILGHLENHLVKCYLKQLCTDN